MKNNIKIFFVLLFVVLMSACKNEKSLQSYLVESQDRNGFMAIDLPVSFLKLKNDKVSKEVKQTLKSIRKINVVALPIEGNEDVYEIEKETLKTIFKDNKKYKTLMSMKAKGMNVKLYYAGKTEAIDEVIAFGYGKNAGVGVARLLGDNMNPGKIVEMMNNINIDTDNLDFSQLKAILESN